MKHVARKRFGQNFLVDKYIIEQIINKINPQKTDTVIEIGPGLGAITKPLLTLLNTLNVIEIDRDLVQKLSEKNYSNLIIFNEDALKFNFNRWNKMTLVGNLPYNISTPLLFHLLKFKDNIHTMYFMLQKELVNRICAIPNNKTYGRLSIILQAQCEVEELLIVSPQAFKPSPKVTSSIIKITPKKNDIDHCLLSKVVKIAFAKRRKTLFNNFKPFADQINLSDLPINLGLRAENLSVIDFIKLSKFFYKIV